PAPPSLSLSLQPPTYCRRTTRLRRLLSPSGRHLPSRRLPLFLHPPPLHIPFTHFAPTSTADPPPLLLAFLPPTLCPPTPTAQLPLSQPNSSLPIPVARFYLVPLPGLVGWFIAAICVDRWLSLILVYLIIPEPLPPSSLNS
ncbi:hypothetical protein LINPERHAP2_LOCUS32613, partial [Linum perenne]